MEEFNNDIFKFDAEDDSSSTFFQQNNFQDDNIENLSEDMYENENLFNLEVEQNNQPSVSSDFLTQEQNIFSNFKSPSLETDNNMNTYLYDSTNINNQENAQKMIDDQEKQSFSENHEMQNDFENINISDIEDDEPIYEVYETYDKNINTNNEDANISTPQQEETISFTDTPIEELNKLTDYEPDNIDATDINSLFDRVSVNVKDASEIFRKNTDLKQKIDSRFEELKKLQNEVANSRQNQIDEINAYKEEVFNKLTEKKEEIEKRLNLLKETQVALDKEKKEFELYKRKEQQNIEKVQKEVQSAYDDRREELGRIEDILRKQKDSLDEQRSQLSLDRIQYEADKNELANNLLKFNELVNSFTNGMNDIKE